MKFNKSAIPLLGDPKGRSCLFVLFIATSLICGAFFIGIEFLRDPFRLSQGFAINNTDQYTNSVRCEVTPIVDNEVNNTTENIENDNCKDKCRPVGTEALPKGIVSTTSNLEMYPLTGPVSQDKSSKNTSLLAVAAGIKQKTLVDRIVTKFLGDDFVVMIFHYDGIVDEWREFEWNDRVIHVSAKSQTKWWFAKRFLHPDIVAEYDYIFLWDEDLGVEKFNPQRYLSIVKEEGLEISQPGLDLRKSEVHHHITIKIRRSRVHRRFVRPGRCEANSTAPPCVGWVEMMAPVFSRASWRCAWYMIQNDLIHAWGLDMQLGYCAQGDRTVKVGVVDEEYIVHMGLPTLGGNSNKNKETNPESSSTTQSSDSKNSPDLNSLASSGSGTNNSSIRIAVRQRCYYEMWAFGKRWKKAVMEDKCWVDPFSTAT